VIVRGANWPSLRKGGGGLGITKEGIRTNLNQHPNTPAL